MKYLCLIYEAEAVAAQRTEQQNQEVMQAYFDFTNSINESNHFVAGEPLMPTETATTVRIRDGETLVTDGPFAETKEQLGGYYLIEAENLDEALGVASRIPSAKTGSIEVRPIMVFDE